MGRARGDEFEARLTTSGGLSWRHMPIAIVTGSAGLFASKAARSVRQSFDMIGLEEGMRARCFCRDTPSRPLGLRSNCAPG